MISFDSFGRSVSILSGEYSKGKYIKNCMSSYYFIFTNTKFRSQHRIELLDKLKFQLNASVIQKYEADYTEPNPLDGCLHVFIDLGSNRGLQIRKLYEPHNFPLAPVLPLYEKFFGRAETRSLKELCSVSFEPNSKHAAHLRGMAEAYATCGINMLVMEAGVGHKDTVYVAIMNLLSVESFFFLD